MKIGILGNAKKVKSPEIIEKFVQFVTDCGYPTVVFSNFTEISGVDVVIVLGGDGAILHASVMAAKQGIKIIGVNYGNLGFLTEYEKDDCEKLKELLSQVEKAKCRILKRTLLQVEIAGRTFYALNEVAFQRNYGVTAEKTTQILKLSVHTNEGQQKISGDGALVCTPTGSTAYSLSAGGAILTPEVPVFMITPICAFSMRARPTVISDDEEMIVKIEKGKSVMLVDGLTVGSLPEGSAVFIKKAPFTADFPVRDNSDFFAKVKNKLNE